MAWACTYAPVRLPEKGSLENPICTATVQAQRQYLRRLRYADGAKVAYQRQKPVVGPDRRILDPYHIHPTGVDLVEELQPDGSRRLVLYLVLDVGCKESEAPPSFTLAETED